MIYSLKKSLKNLADFPSHRSETGILYRKNISISNTSEKSEFIQQNNLSISNTSDFLQDTAKMMGENQASLRFKCKFDCNDMFCIGFQ